MQLNIFTDYALRVLLYVAARNGERCTSDEIATAFGVSRNHLVKVINELQHLGYLETRRGRAGGVALASAPNRIRIGEIVRRTESTMTLVECFDRKTNQCPLARACGLKSALGDAFEAFFEVLDRYTLADFVAEPRWASRLISLTAPERRRSLNDHRAI